MDDIGPNATQQHHSQDALRRNLQLLKDWPHFKGPCLRWHDLGRRTLSTPLPVAMAEDLQEDETRTTAPPKRLKGCYIKEFFTDVEMLKFLTSTPSRHLPLTYIRLLHSTWAPIFAHLTGTSSSPKKYYLRNLTQESRLVKFDLDIPGHTDSDGRRVVDAPRGSIKTGNNQPRTEPVPLYTQTSDWSEAAAVLQFGACPAGY